MQRGQQGERGCSSVGFRGLFVTGAGREWHRGTVALFYERALFLCQPSTARIYHRTLPRPTGINEQTALYKNTIAYQFPPTHRGEKENITAAVPVGQPQVFLWYTLWNSDVKVTSLC